MPCYPWQKSVNLEDSDVNIFTNRTGGRCFYLFSTESVQNKQLSNNRAKKASLTDWLCCEENNLSILLCWERFCPVHHTLMTQYGLSTGYPVTPYPSKTTPHPASAFHVEKWLPTHQCDMKRAGPLKTPLGPIWSSGQEAFF